jgi:hypothetical protein
VLLLLGPAYALVIVKILNLNDFFISFEDQVIDLLRLRNVEDGIPPSVDLSDPHEIVGLLQFVQEFPVFV